MPPPQTQLLHDEAQEINVGIERAQFEHAIAMLIGRPPAELTVGNRMCSTAVSREFRVTVPSTLLERRPDIAAAERTMQQENALIGVAEAAFYPDISLSGVLEWTGRHPLPFSVANEVWSLGAAGTQVLFDGGLRAAQIDAARAVYWQSVANYRQTVLTAFQQVEDNLAAVRLLKQQLVLQQKAVKDAAHAPSMSSLNQFRGRHGRLSPPWSTAEITAAGRRGKLR